MKAIFQKTIDKVIKYAEELGIKIVDTSELDPYFKGDLDGETIWISKTLPQEEQLFNILHLIGHTAQWNINHALYELGSVLHEKPDNKLLKRLQKYEWEANCYAAYILTQVGAFKLMQWLQMKYLEDMYYLTHYYKTGEKVREVTDVAIKHQFDKPLLFKKIPEFTASAKERRTNGIVIQF